VTDRSMIPHPPYRLTTRYGPRRCSRPRRNRTNSAGASNFR
jgi:hypothetical protein